jgi:ABC-type nitrate/sulfonate/bicarbonate transport system substrate-binding protein
MRLAIPDLISNSYFPALAAAELGFFAAEGLDVAAELIFPVDRCYEALRDGDIDFVGGAAPSCAPISASHAATLRRCAAGASAPHRGSRWGCGRC